MKNIKFFKYVSKKGFDVFLKEYGYILENVKGFSFGGKEQYHGNILKAYNIHFKDGEYKIFRIVLFKSFNEYNQTRLGFNGNKLLMGYDSANIRKYKLNID